jgi:glutamyl/glutaminyl-tRNA synthetase
MSVAEMIQRFSLDGINRKSAIFDVAKLDWMNGQYISALAAEELEPLVSGVLREVGMTSEELLSSRRGWYLRLIDLLKTRARVIHDIADQAAPYLADSVEYQPDAVQKHWREPNEVAARLQVLRRAFVELTEWTPTTLEQELRSVADQLGVAAGKLIHPLRVALLGTSVSPGIFDVLAVLGRDVSLRRIDDALVALQS